MGIGLSNKKLNRRKFLKDDEFYTRYVDIERELANYKELFRDKVVYLNCDHALESNFFKFFYLNFNEFCLRELICTGYCEGGRGSVVVCDRGGGVESLWGVRTRLLSGDGDFSSKECLEYLMRADIVVTNPPFSLLRKFILLMYEYGKDFLVVGNVNIFENVKFFHLFKDGKIQFGFNRVRYFNSRDGGGRSSNSIWLTNLAIKKNVNKLKLKYAYVGNEFRYPKYDNYDAIEVSRTRLIPMGYSGFMGVPISFLTFYTPSQFELIGLDKEVLRGVTDRFYLNNKRLYVRVLIRHRSN